MLWRSTLTALGAIHLLVVLWHGAAHAELAVALSAAQNLFVYVVIVLVPLAAVILLWTRHAMFALWLFLAATSASLLFGVCYHYPLVSPDNVRHLPEGSAAAHAHFTLSAAILVLVEGGSVVAAAFSLRQSVSRGSGLA
jgi:cytochrome bd-type quinol oxidase subunit 2